MLTTRAQPFFRRLPAARTYLRENGLRRTLRRIAHEIFGGAQRAKSSEAAEHGDLGQAAAPLASPAVRRPGASGPLRASLRDRAAKVALLREHIGRRPRHGLEISPNILPMMTSGDGITVQYLDVRTTEQLLERATEKGVDPGSVPRIDFVYDMREPISECVGGRKFDFVLSCHVIEHIPNLIGHFRDVSRILDTGGVYCLMIPDMSLCFDANKTPTTLGLLMEAFLNDWKHPPLAAMIDDYRSAVWLGGKNAWSVEDSGIFSPKYKNRRAQIAKVLANPAVVEGWHGHIWRFTPESFHEIFTEIRSFGLLDLRIRAVIPTHRVEFLCVMEKGPADQ